MAQTYNFEDDCLPGNHFHVSREGNEILMSAELSTLGIKAGQEFMRQIYPDACDIGIAIGGKRETVIFYLSETDEHREGSGWAADGWNFKPIPEAIRKNPALEHLSVLLIND